MSTCDKSASDMFLSLNGFDEIAVSINFGKPPMGLREDEMTFLRALAFVDQRRQGLKDKEAHQAAMSLTISEVTGYFAKDDDELDPENPETDQGKDSAP